MSDEWAYWRAALALVGDCGKVSRPQVAALGGITMEPRCGFYRKPVTDVIDGKRVKRPPLPVAIWRDGDEFRCLLDGKDADAADVWTYCATHPISEDTYRLVAERREWWPEGVAA